MMEQNNHFSKMKKLSSSLLIRKMKIMNCMGKQVQV